MSNRPVLVVTIIIYNINKLVNLTNSVKHLHSITLGIYGVRLTGVADIRVMVFFCGLMELDLKSLFGLHVYSCTHWLITPLPRIWAHIRGRYWTIVSQDSRHLFVTRCPMTPCCVTSAKKSQAHALSNLTNVCTICPFSLLSLCTTCPKYAYMTSPDMANPQFPPPPPPFLPLPPRGFGGILTLL